MAIAAGGLPQGEFQNVMKFDLSGVSAAFDAQFGAGQWTVQSVRLQLTSSPHGNPIFNQIAPGSFGISWMQNDSWIEGTGTGGIPTTDGISFSSLQNTYINNVNDQALGTFSFPGGDSGVNVYELTLTPGLLADIQSGGLLSLRLFAEDDEVSYLFSSRSTGSAANRPTLIITVPEPSATALAIIGGVMLAMFRRVRRARLT
jgi:hypothetical protein